MNADTTSTWEPHTEVSTEIVAPGPVAALAALLDDGLAAPKPGDPLPPLWHWVALPQWATSGVLGADGHPTRGTFLPPIELPRRMFAGGSIVFSGTLTVGETVVRESEVLTVSEKNGRSGQLVIVDVRTRLHNSAGDVAIEEIQNLAYRPAAPSPANPERERPSEFVNPAPPLSQVSSHEWALRTDPSLLMRFSAATANAHRIHYDWPYATQVEGYPGLVVHGPFQALALAEIHRLSGGAPVKALTHRGNAPLFCGELARLTSTARPDGKLLELFGPRGEPAKPSAVLDLITT